MEIAGYRPPPPPPEYGTPEYDQWLWIVESNAMAYGLDRFVAAIRATPYAFKTPNKIVAVLESTADQVRQGDPPTAEEWEQMQQDHLIEFTRLMFLYGDQMTFDDD